MPNKIFSCLGDFMCDYVQILERYSDYSVAGNPVSFQYQDSDDINLSKIRVTTGLNFKHESDLEKALMIMNYVFRTLIRGNRDYVYYQKKCNTLDILSATKKNFIESNCLMYSVVLSEILLAFGIRARVVICRPYNFYENTNCHCMVHAFIRNLNKWVVLDPAYNAMYRDEKGLFLNIQELRNIIISREHYSIFSYREEKLKVMNEIKSYLPQYLVVFFSLQKNYFNCFSNTDNNVVNILMPKKYETAYLNTVRDDKTNITFNDIAFWNS